MSAEVTANIERNQQRVNLQLENLSTPAPFTAENAVHLRELDTACRYVVNNGGKRIRPSLLYLAADAISGHNSNQNQNEEGLDYAACAIELLHTYSLVHDDLPAMDDDDLRRGKPSCHIAFDEATAILVGDGLQARAFELVSIAPGISAEQKVAMLTELASAAGIAGMVGGQHIDISATNTTLTIEQLQSMHQLKTGAIIGAALRLGGIAAGGTEQQLSALARFGEHIGLAFQVVDDILDVTADSTTLGKTSGKDTLANKPTYVSLLGLEGARQKAKALLDDALAALDELGENAESLRSLARYIVDRQH